MNDTPAEAAKKNLIRRRKNLRLVEKKFDSEAKDSGMAPSDFLPANRRLSKAIAIKFTVLGNIPPDFWLPPDFFCYFLTLEKVLFPPGFFTIFMPYTAHA